MPAFPRKLAPNDQNKGTNSITHRTLVTLLSPLPYFLTNTALPHSHFIILATDCQEISQEVSQEISQLISPSGHHYAFTEGTLPTARPVPPPHQPMLAAIPLGSIQTAVTLMVPLHLNINRM
jgi:hypothetical protein